MDRSNKGKKTMEHLPEVRCGLFIEAKFAKDLPPGFEMKVDVVYRDLPQVGLVALEKETAALLARMAAFGEAQLPAE